MKTPRLLTLWIFVCALVGCGPIRADQAFDPEIDDVVDLLSGTFRVRAQHSSKCADVSGVSAANGGIVHQWDCHTADNQKWRAVDLGNGYHNLVAVHSGKCMNVTGVSVDDLATIQQWSCGSGSNQQFKLVVAGAGYQLQARHSGKCVEIAGASNANGAGLVQLPCKGLGTTTGNASQRFAFESTGAVTGGLAGVVSESMFNSMFANRSPFYTYTGLTSINIVYADFANSPDMTIRKREAAAFLANVSWESDWLRATKEYNTANYCNYCGGCGCPAGRCNSTTRSDSAQLGLQLPSGGKQHRPDSRPQSGPRVEQRLDRLADGRLVLEHAAGAGRFRK